jgi:DNA polymerase bacteriophage-type
VNSISKKWSVERTYGGRLVENIVQSIARDVMAENMLDERFTPVMTVHDEIVWEVPEGQEHLPYAPSAPSWASGLPVASKLAVGRRYAK